MSFDLSRISFDARNDFLGVVMQQGRVQLDADWNEWVAQLARRIQAGTFDIFGNNVVPRVTPNGFHIEVTGDELSIGPGRIYVDGLLAENHGGEPDDWNTPLAELTGTTPLDYTAQPYFPEPPALPDGGPHLVYLDVWQRDVTALQEPDLIEKAVGVDTTARLQTVWQVKVLPEVGDITCTTPDENIPGWLNTMAPSAGRLSTDTTTVLGDPDPCKVPPAAGYLGLENQLYRVEVHTGGPLGTATFKWSRDNATVASRVSHINPARDRITVESIGRDDVLRFNNGDWVEVTDDRRELHNLPGELRRIRLDNGVDETARTIEFETPLTAGLFLTDGQQATTPERNTRVRRWDQTDQVRDENGTGMPALFNDGEITIRPAGKQLVLENGILVEFDLDATDGQFKSGDYWVFTARSADASIETLNNVPPLGIHHHYARLALVTFPNAETDCRTLWPPIVEGESCDCTVCVSAEGHNADTATIQQAIDSIKDTGGTLCLGIGTYHLPAALNVDGARSLRIRGQGWSTLLVGDEPGGIFYITGSTGVALENLTVIGSGGNTGVTTMIMANNVVDLRVKHINVLGVAVGDGTSIGIGLSGYVLGVSITDCALVAKHGIARVSHGDRKYLLTNELHVAGNILFCNRRAVSFNDVSLHYGNTCIEHNLMLVGKQAAIVVNGAVLSGSSMCVADNAIYTASHGIRAGVNGLAIERNEITGIGNRSGNGIVLEEGIDPLGVENIRISTNHLLGLRGNGIVLTHRVENAIIRDNMIKGMGQGALVMSEGGAAEYLCMQGNRFINLGERLDNVKDAFSGVQLIRVKRGDVLDNVIANVARTAISSRAINGLRAVAIGQLRIAGNRFYGIGPDRLSGQAAAARFLPPFDRLAIDNNSIDRIADSKQEPMIIEWHAINIAPQSRTPINHLAAAAYISTEKVAYLLTAARAMAVQVQRSTVSIRGNQLRGHLTRVPLNECHAVDSCLFAENHCEVIGSEGKEPLLGNLSARTINAGNNRLVARIGKDTLHLHPHNERAIVMGNTSTGKIVVKNGVPVPSDIDLTNIIGI